jgi:hypothetical protein
MLHQHQRHHPPIETRQEAHDAYLAVDITNIEPLISKGFKFQTFPKDRRPARQSEGGTLREVGTVVIFYHQN